MPATIVPHAHVAEILNMPVRTPAAMVGLVVVLLGGCALPDGAEGDALAPPTLPASFPESSTGIELPTPPPPELPRAFPDDAAAASEAPANARPSAASNVAGYAGSEWADRVEGAVVVLADTVSQDADRVFGLVSNASTQSVGPVVVMAGGASATVPVPVLRPGEPAPFVLTVDDGVQVDPATITVDAPSTDQAPPRALQLVTYWERTVGDPLPVDTHLYSDPESGPLPSVAFGAVRSAEPVEGLVVVAAWMDDDGRVVWVDPDAALQHERLDAGEWSDFLVEGGTGDALSGATLQLWASGS